MSEQVTARPVPQRAVGVERQRPGVPRRLLALARRHRAFTAVALAGLLLRGLVLAAYRPALVYQGDSTAYLTQADHHLWPDHWRPPGYVLFLRLFGGSDHLLAVAVAQHLLTFGVALGAYVLVRRLGHGPVAGVAAAAPAALDPLVVDLGQFVLADSLFGTMLAAAVLVLGRPGRLSLAACATGGLLLGAAAVVRTSGTAPLLAAAVVLLASARVLGVRRLAAFAVAAVLPLVGFASWKAANDEGFTISAHSGFFLYGRLVPFADCDVLSRPDLRALCDPRPVGERPQPDWYLWRDEAPLRRGGGDIAPGREKLAGEAAGEILRAQPGMVVRTSATYLLGYFDLGRYDTAKTSRADTWYLPRHRDNVLPANDPSSADGYYEVWQLNTALAAPLAWYSRWIRLPMPLVGLALLAGLGAGLASALAALARRRGRRPRRVEAPPRAFWLAAGTALGVLGIGALTAGFDYRYLASVLPLLGVAAVLGVTSLSSSLSSTLSSALRRARA